MTRTLSVVWPDPRPFADRDGAPIRLLAVSDAPDPALEYETNRAGIGPIDAIVGCGDLEPGYLGFLGDAFRVPVAFVRGNHDRGGQWAESAAEAPQHLASGHLDPDRRHHGRAVRVARTPAGHRTARRDPRLAGRRPRLERSGWAAAERPVVTGPRRESRATARGGGLRFGPVPRRASPAIAGSSSASGRRSGSTATRRPRASPIGAIGSGRRSWPMSRGRSWSSCCRRRRPIRSAARDERLEQRPVALRLGISPV